MKLLEVEGEHYEVLEDLGFQHSACAYVKEVKTDNGPRVVVCKSRSGPWNFWTPRIEPRGPIIGQ